MTHALDLYGSDTLSENNDEFFRFTILLSSMFHRYAHRFEYFKGFTAFPIRHDFTEVNQFSLYSIGLVGRRTIYHS